MERYGTPYAAEYNLTKVTTPVYLVGADSDPFAPPKVMTTPDCLWGRH